MTYYNNGPITSMACQHDNHDKCRRRDKLCQCTCHPYNKKKEKIVAKNAIYKYRLDIGTGTQQIWMFGKDPVVRHIDVQDGVLYAWVEVDLNSDELISNFRVVATGEPYTAEAWKHVGSALMDKGRFVWHVLQGVKL